MELLKWLKNSWFMIRFIFSVLAIGGCLGSYAQNYLKNPNVTDASGKRQGAWTIFYDTDWDEVAKNSDRIVYYRLVSYKDDKPTSIVKDYYKNGVVQFEGNIIQDRPEELREGDCIFYDEKGIKRQVSTYKNNKLVSQVYYDAQGNVDSNSFDIITEQADGLYENKKYKEAVILYEKAKEKAEKTDGKISDNYATACNNLAFCYEALGEDVLKIEALYKETRQVKKQKKGEKSASYASSCYNMGYFYDQQGNDAKAEEFYLEAKKIYEDINKKDRNAYTEIIFRLANIYDKQQAYTKAEPYYKEALIRAEKKYSKESATYALYLYRLARYYKKQGKYTEAEKMMDEVIQTNAKVLAKKHKDKQIAPVRLVKNAPKSIKHTNLGTNVNTKYAELVPFITADGKTLYFDTKYNPENTGGVKDSDEVYYAELQSDGSWGKAKNIGKPINNKSPNAVIAVTPDNNTALVVGTYKEDGSWGGAGVSMTQRTETGWSLPKKVEIKNNYNKNKFVDYSLSADGKTLIISTQRDDTFGEKDLCVSFLQDDGTWSEPKNLGSTINTFADESSPFLAPDGASLYFATNGFPTYGNSDIFVSRRLDDTWQRWSEPENLGHEINTEKADSYFVIPASGKYAYMVTFSESIGEQDIIQLELPEELAPKPVVMISGKVLNAKTQKPIGAKITYRDLETDKELGVANSSPVDGSYKIVLPSGNAYSFLAEKKGFIATSSNLNVENLQKYREVQQDLLLSPIEVGQTIRLNNIFFDTDKFELRGESTAELARFIKVMNENPNLIIEIGGHTDAVGNEQKNIQLSQNRADAVKNHLVSKGVAASRLSSKGYGKSKPIAANTTDEGRQQNRRVEFSIVK